MNILETLLTQTPPSPTHHTTLFGWKLLLPPTNEVWGKVMFLLSVSFCSQGVLVSVPGVSVSPSRGSLSLHLGGLCLSDWGVSVSLVLGVSVSLSGWSLSRWGICLGVSGGSLVRETPRTVKSGGTYPTGMHSC